MGRRSIENFTCNIKLSITNGPFYDYVMNKIDEANVPEIFRLKTYNCGKILHRHDLVNAGMICTHTTIKYTIEMDMYNIVKKKTNRVISHAVRIFPKIRRKFIMKEIKKEMTYNFNQKIKQAARDFGGVIGVAFAGAIVELKSVDVYRLKKNYK